MTMDNNFDPLLLNKQDRTVYLDSYIAFFMILRAGNLQKEVSISTGALKIRPSSKGALNGKKATAFGQKDELR